MNTQLDITQLLEHFRDDQDVMKPTRKQYYNIVRLYFAWLDKNGYNWRELSISQLIKYKDYLYIENKTPLTIRYYFIILKRFFKWLSDNGINPNISEGIKLPRRDSSFQKKALTVEQARRLLENIDRQTIIGKRDYALFTLLFTTGLRSISVEEINIGDMNEYHGVTVVWYRNKGSRRKENFKAITNKCIDAVEDYLLYREGFQDHWPLFATHSHSLKGQRLTRQSMRLIFKNRLKEIGINDPHITLHSTRHTHGFISIEAVGAYETQLSLNHKSAQTTRIYNNAADEKILLNNRTGKAIEDILL